jgi:trk system potassium uptake protein
MKQYLVVGLGRFGSSIAKTLYESGEQVLAMDNDEEIVQESVNIGIIENGITADATDAVVLKNLGINNFDVAFVCIGTNIQDSIMVTLTLKELGIPKIIAKATTEVHGKLLSKIGADEVIYPEIYMGARVAMKEIEPNIVEHMKFGDNYILAEINAPEKFLNKTLEKLAIRKNYKANIIAIKKESGEMQITPMGDTIMSKGDTMIVITDTQTAKKLKELK